MLEEKVKYELLREGCIAAALLHFGLNPLICSYPVVRELPLAQREQSAYLHKFAVFAAGRPALVYCDWDEGYVVRDDHGRELTDEEKEAKETYQILQVAAQYLELDMARVGRLRVYTVRVPLTPGAPYAAQWWLLLGDEIAHVVRYDEPDGSRYEVME